MWVYPKHRTTQLFPSSVEKFIKVTLHVRCCLHWAGGRKGDTRRQPNPYRLTVSSAFKYNSIQAVPGMNLLFEVASGPRPGERLVGGRKLQGKHSFWIGFPSRRSSQSTTTNSAPTPFWGSHPGGEGTPVFLYKMNTATLPPF